MYIIFCYGEKPFKIDEIEANWLFSIELKTKKKKGEKQRPKPKTKKKNPITKKMDGKKAMEKFSMSHFSLVHL